MNSFFRRTVRGYLTIFRGTAALAAALVTLAAVSVAITLPLWFLATTTPVLFTWLTVGTAIVFGVVWVSRKMSRRGRRATAWASALAWGGCGLAIAAGLAIGSPTLLIAGIAAGSLVLARRLAP